MGKKMSKVDAGQGEWKMGSKIVVRGMSVLLAVLLLLTLLPAKTVQAAEVAKLQLSFKVGSTAATVNGKKIVIQQPFIENGTVMVPLGVFKKAFGSTVSLEEDNVVKVMYGPHTGAMTIGSLTAWKDGVKIKLTAPPHMVGDVLMVPLRYVAGVLGARISPGNGGELLVTLVPAESDEETPVENGIDSDVGKTRIGNSYFHWSMNYPSGLIVGDSGGNESVATFMSAENLYYLEVHATLQEVSVEPEEMLEQLVRDAEEGGETVLDRETFPQGPVPYARIVSKDTSGAIWEGRQYYADGRLYEIYLTDDKAVNYKDLDKYNGLLNSFQPSFDTKDKKIRDLSTVVNGLRPAYNEDYGISLQIPANWSMDEQHLLFESNKGSQLSVKVTSAPSGSTLNSWSQELETKTRESFVPTAYTLKGSTMADVSGVQAQINEMQLNFGNGWATEYQVLLLKNGYRYYFQYMTPAGEEADKARFADILATIDIDFDLIKENFGRLDVDDYTALKNKSITKISKTYGFVVDIPRLWTPYQDAFEMQNVEYRFTGGRFQIYANPEGSVEYAVNLLKDYYQNKNADPKGPRIESVVESTFAGQAATTLIVHQSKNGIPSLIKQIIFSNNEVVYTITLSLDDANATAEQQAILDQTLQSFRFTGDGM